MLPIDNVKLTFQRTSPDMVVQYLIDEVLHGKQEFVNAIEHKETDITARNILFESGNPVKVIITEGKRTRLSKDWDKDIIIIAQYIGPRNVDFWFVEKSE